MHGASKRSTRRHAHCNQVPGAPPLRWRRCPRRRNRRRLQRQQQQLGNGGAPSPATLVSTCDTICDNLSPCASASLAAQCLNVCNDSSVVPATCINQFASYLACLAGAKSVSCQAGGQYVLITPTECETDWQAFVSCNANPSIIAARTQVQTNTPCASPGGRSSASVRRAAAWLGSAPNRSGLGRTAVRDVGDCFALRRQGTWQLRYVAPASSLQEHPLPVASCSQIDCPSGTGSHVARLTPGGGPPLVCGSIASPRRTSHRRTRRAPPNRRRGRARLPSRRPRPRAGWRPRWRRRNLRAAGMAARTGRPCSRSDSRRTGRPARYTRGLGARRSRSLRRFRCSKAPRIPRRPLPSGCCCRRSARPRIDRQQGRRRRGPALHDGYA